MNVALLRANVAPLAVSSLNPFGPRLQGEPFLSCAAAAAAALSTAVENDGGNE